MKRGEFFRGTIRRGNCVVSRGTQYMNKHRKFQGAILNTSETLRHEHGLGDKDHKFVAIFVPTLGLLKCNI